MIPGRLTAAVVFGAVGVLAAVELHVLSEEEWSGPPHEDVTIGNGIPATFYVPGTVDRSREVFPDPPLAGDRPPVVVLAHGFSADRAVMSSLARRLAAAGYAVVAFDFRGHGANRNGFRAGELGADLDQVVGWASRSPYADPRRIVVMGHSMGATAVLEFATRDARPAAVVALSGAQRLADRVDIGGNIVDGPRRPPNVLFLWATGDPAFIRDESRHLASRVAGQPIEPDHTYGDFATSSAVRATVLDGLNHGTELWSGKTVVQVVGWLDQVFGISRSQPPATVDPRLRTAGLYLLSALVLIVGLGFLVGQLSPSSVPLAPVDDWRGLGMVASSLLIALPFSGPVSVAGFLSLAAGDAVVSYLAIAGGVLVVLVVCARRRADAGAAASSPRGTGLPAAIATLGVYVVLAPLGSVGHRLVPTPERLLAAVPSFVVVAPFFVCFQSLVRRGRAGAAAMRSVIGQLLLVLGIGTGARLGMFPGVVGLQLPVFVIVFVLVELMAPSFHPSGRSTVVVGLIEAALLAWMVSVMAPIG